MGAAAARDLAARGFHVLAGVRRERDGDAIRAEGVEPVILDITRADHVAALVDRITSDPEHRPLRALINNAGVSINAPVEAFLLDEWRRLFDINVFGHIAMTQALLPLLVKSHGRIVNISSVGGKVAMATYGPYAGTKFALEAVSDSLRRELADQGVQVVVIEPGAVRTKMGDRGAVATADHAARMSPELQRRYRGIVTASLSHAAAHLGEGLSADRAGSVIAKAATARRPRTRYTVGRDAAMLTLLVRLLPDRILDWLLAVTLRDHFPKGGTVWDHAAPTQILPEADISSGH